MASEAPPKRPRLPESEKDSKLWQGITKLFLRNGEVIEVVKVLMVMRYVIVVRSTGDEPLLISKHSVEKAVLRKVKGDAPPS